MLKKFLLSAMLGTALLPNYLEAQTRWPLTEQTAFLEECAKSSEGQNALCSCMLEQIMEKYPTVAQAEKITDAEMQTIAEHCINKTQWPLDEQAAFIKSCQEGAKDNSNAVPLCSCMLPKIMKLYPDAKDVDKLTNEQVDKMLEECSK